MTTALLRYTAVSAGAVMLLATAAVGASSATIDTTGPGSWNKVRFQNSHTVKTANKTNVTATNNNPQDAKSGNAKVYNNTTGGDATSGGASNDSSLDASLTVSNTGSGGGFGGSSDDSGDISNTGPNSTNEIVFKNKTYYSTYNSTNLSVTNNNTQKATTGSATVSTNTTGGDATSGDASNTSSATMTFDVSN